MASLKTKRSWKLQEFTAHSANVHCLALGHKSGRVMVTGGDDNKVNLWAIGKSSCFMSLSGHVSPIECVQFNQLEELVCAGSRAGALKVWDLEAAKLVRTLNGHKHMIKSIDFHPYGDFLGSGSADASIKMWDTRKKNAVFTYNNHKGDVNSIKFSPDGQWVASGGEDASVKIWDLRVGRVLKEFKDHLSAVTCVEFHPHEFLLATGGLDRSVHLFDLENFNLVSSEREVGAVRSMCFNPDGECLFTGVRDYLKVVGWEPSRLYDSVPVNWGRVNDVSTAQNMLVGASFLLTSVQVYMVDLKKIRPLGQHISLDNTPNPFIPNQSIRKSFSKAESPISLKNRTLDVKTIEESTSGTDPEEESTADITNVNDYEEIFKGKGLRRTPPPEPELMVAPSFHLQSSDAQILDPTAPQILGDITGDSFEALSLDNNLNNYNLSHSSVTTVHYPRSKSNLDQVYTRKQSKQQDRENILPNVKARNTAKYNLQRQSSCKDVPEKEKNARSNAMRHSLSEDLNVSRGSVSVRGAPRKNSFSKSNTKIPSSARTSEVSERMKPDYSSKLSEEQTTRKEAPAYVPMAVNKPVGLNMDDFLPKNHQTMGFHQQQPDLSEAEVINVVMRGHEPFMNILELRQRGLRVVLAAARSKDVKTAMETAINMDDLHVLVDFLGVINNNYSVWNLDLCVLVLSKMVELLQSKYEKIMATGCNSLRIMLMHFGATIKNNKSPVGSWGVDISREERYNKCKKCYECLLAVRPIVQEKISLPKTLGGTFREIATLLDNVIE